MNSTLRGFALLGLAVGVVSAATGCGLVTRDSTASTSLRSITVLDVLFKYASAR